MLILILPFTILISLPFLIPQTFSGTICFFSTTFSSAGMFFLSAFGTLSLICKFIFAYSFLCPSTHFLCPCRLAIMNSPYLVDYPVSFINHNSIFFPSYQPTHPLPPLLLPRSVLARIFLSAVSNSNFCSPFSSCSNCKHTCCNMLKSTWLGFQQLLPSSCQKQKEKKSKPEKSCTSFKLEFSFFKQNI